MLAEGSEPAAVHAWNATALLLLNLSARRAAPLLVTGAPTRLLSSLFGFTLPTSLSNLTGQVASYVGSSTSQVVAAAAGIPGLSSIVQVFSNAKSLLQRGQQVIQTAWASFLNLAQQLGQIFTTFQPLKPVFARGDGLLRLITNATNVHALVAVVQELLSTSGVLRALSQACRTIVDIFQQVSGVLRSGTEKLDEGSARRLSVDEGRQLTGSSYESLLNGISFQGLVEAMSGFLDKATTYVDTLDQVNTSLGPLLASLGSLTGRRLQESMVANQQIYQRAIEQIVPTWQGVESLGIAMCPQVDSARGLASTLRCRVDGFVSHSGALSALAGLLGDCPTGGTASTSEASTCPTESMSAGVTDLLSKNSLALSWILAGAVAMGCLGAGGIGAFVSRGLKEGDSSGSGEETGDDPEEGTELMRGQYREAVPHH